MRFIFPIFGEPYDGLIAVALILFITVGWRPIRMLWRMLRPIPQEDVRAIERALSERNQTLDKLTKRWFGGPWAYVGPRTPIPYQSGRPYSVRCKTQSGQIVEARLVIDGIDKRGDPVVRERTPEGWRTISKLRAALETLVL